MQEKEEFLFKREINRLLDDLKKCSDPQYRKLIDKDLKFLRSVIGNYN